MPEAPVPDVSVSIVNTANREALLACLDSLEAEHAGATSFEVVVLDNASDDGSVEAVRAAYPSVRVIAQRRRAGFGANHNTVIRATRGRYVYVLNDDTLVEPGSFDRMVAYLDAHPRVAALGPHVVFPDGREQASAWRFPSPSTSIVTALTLARGGATLSGGQDIRPVDWVFGCAILLRRSALDAVGAFDEGFFIYSEETDLCRRLADAGFQTVYFPPVTLVHIGNATTNRLPERRLNELWRSRHRYWAKHHGAAGARVAATATGLQYLAFAGLVSAALRLPARLRTDRVSAVDGQVFLHQARAALRGVRGPGIAELADDWNAAHPDAGP
jgi:hypothetical protein